MADKMAEQDYKQKKAINDKMAATLKAIEAKQTNHNVYIPPRFRVKDPIASEPVKEHLSFIPTSRDYGLNPQSEQTLVKRFPKSNKFSSGLIGKNYINNGLNTSFDGDSLPSSSSSLSF